MNALLKLLGWLSLNYKMIIVSLKQSCIPNPGYALCSISLCLPSSVEKNVYFLVFSINMNAVPLMFPEEVMNPMFMSYKKTLR